MRCLGEERRIWRILEGGGGGRGAPEMNGRRIYIASSKPKGENSPAYY